MVNEESLSLLSSARRSPFQLTPKTDFLPNMTSANNNTMNTTNTNPNGNGSNNPTSATANVSSTTISLAPITLTNDELNELKTIDSRLYKTAMADELTNINKPLIHKAIKAIETALLNRSVILKKVDKKEPCNSPTITTESGTGATGTNGTKSSANTTTTNDNRSFQVDPNVFCQLGHYNLLIGNYSKALSAYQQYYKLEPDNWKNSAFLFSMGLMYFHYNAMNWAIKAFKLLVYCDPEFARLNEVHLRLGLIYKRLKQYQLSLKHFRLALNDSSPCSLTKSDLEFHIAHLYEVQGKFASAKDQYLKLIEQLKENDPLRSDVWRQLGWMHHVVKQFDSSTDTLDISKQQLEAAEYLHLSLQINKNSSQSHYFLGRCYAVLNRAHEAFRAYRLAVDKADANADTWCSIGLLYQQQNQSLDALQAYICSAQLDKYHVAAWTNLGILYESHNQLHDALRCYLNATKEQGKNADESIVKRIRYLEEQLPNLSQVNGTFTLPSLEEAWNHSVQTDNTKNMKQNTQPNNNNNSQTLTTQQAMAPNEHFISNKRQKSEHGTYIETNGHLNHHPHHHSLGHHKAVNNSSNAINNEQQYKKFIGQGPMLGRGGYRDSIDSDAMSNHTHSSEDSHSLAGDLKEPFSSQFSSSDSYFSLSTGPNTNLPGSTQIPTSRLPGSAVDTAGSSPSLPYSAENSPKLDEQPRIHIGMTSDEIARECKACPRDCKIISSIASDDGRPPYPPDMPYPPLPKSKLQPPTPSVLVETKREAFSSELQKFCVTNDIAVVRNIATVLKLDLGLFSTKTLVESNADSSIEVRKQFVQPADQNWDKAHQLMVWYCESQRSHTTIAQYANYQASSFKESVLEEKDKNGFGSNYNNNSDSDSGSNISKKNRKDKHKQNPIPKLVKFGTNVDLSDETKWKPQLQELQKLPPFARVVSPCNMLSHVGHTILGMNSVQLYMKVPGCRTPGHQENNNFCSVNINIGPGDCEWFGVAHEYWGEIHRICERNNIDYLHGSWWPLINDLQASNVPYYRFTQKPGDLVWVGSGTVHWVQAIGWCNNIAWNVGPFDANQYKYAIERYEWNKHEHFKSIVPMIHLTWNLARNTLTTDRNLYSLIRSVLMRSLKYNFMVVNQVKSFGIDIQWHGKRKNEPAHYCFNCDVEVFNILFVRPVERKNVVHCFYCAKKISPRFDGFTVLEEYNNHDICEVYDRFTLLTK